MVRHARYLLIGNTSVLVLIRVTVQRWGYGKRIATILSLVMLPFAKEELIVIVANNSDYRKQHAY